MAKASTIFASIDGHIVASYSREYGHFILDIETAVGDELKIILSIGQAKELHGSLSPELYLAATEILKAVSAK